MSSAQGRRKGPAIRLKATTAPRTTESSVVVARHRLPPPRTPARRVLQIVPDDDGSDRQLVTAAMPMPIVAAANDSHARLPARPIWKRPEVILAALAAFGMVLGIVLALVSSRAPSSASAANEPSPAVERADLRKAQEPPATKPASPDVAPQTQPIPTFDVKSLPPARR